MTPSMKTFAAGTAAALLAALLPATLPGPAADQHTVTVRFVVKTAPAAR